MFVACILNYRISASDIRKQTWCFSNQVQVLFSPIYGCDFLLEYRQLTPVCLGKKTITDREHQCVSTLSNVEQTLVPELDIFESRYKIWKRMQFEERRIYFAYCSMGFPQWCLTRDSLFNSCDRLSVRKRCLDPGGWKDVGLRPQYTFWGLCPD